MFHSRAMKLETSSHLLTHFRIIKIMSLEEKICRFASFLLHCKTGAFLSSMFFMHNKVHCVSNVNEGPSMPPPVGLQDKRKQ